MIVYHVVIDTNVIVSSMLKPESIPRTILNLVESGIVIPIFNKQIIDEYKEVLGRKKFGFDNKDINSIMSTILSHGIEYDGVFVEDEIFPDEKDIVFYEVTMDSMQYHQTRLVTGNIKHFPREAFVVTPRELLDIIIENLD